MLRVLHVGLGAIGRDVVTALLDRKGVELVGVVDTAKGLQHRTVDEVMGRPTGHPISIYPSISAAMKTLGKADVAILTTGSKVESVADTIEECAVSGLHVVSSCEQLSFPQLNYKDTAGRIDRLGKAHGVAVLGTGVNPGFAMDAFALAATAACTKVRKVTVVRTLDASKRRLQLQQKIAAGWSVQQFEAANAKKEIGHVGLAESAAMLAAGLGWPVDRVEEIFTPVIAAQRITTDHFDIQPGQLRGLKMVAHAYSQGRDVVDLDLTMAFAAETFDEVRIDGDRPLVVRTTTGFPGDHCTIALMINAAAAVGGLKPGLRTMLDLVPLRCF